MIELIQKLINMFFTNEGITEEPKKEEVVVSEPDRMIEDPQPVPEFKTDLNLLKCRCGCKEGQEVKVHKRLRGMIKYLEDVFGKPLIVSSGYRCIKHNKTVGGASKSIHLKYPVQAMDFTIERVDAKDVYKAIDEKYPNSCGIGYYVNNHTHYFFVHTDSRAGKARWLRINGVYLKATEENLEKYGLC